MKISHHIEGGCLERVLCHVKWDSTDIGVILSFVGGDKIDFQASRDAVRCLIEGLQKELVAAEKRDDEEKRKKEEANTPSLEAVIQADEAENGFSEVV